MAFHIVTIDTPECFLGCKNGQLICKTEHLQFEILVKSCIEAVVRSFRLAILSPGASLYKPWILKNSKWGG